MPKFIIDALFSEDNYEKAILNIVIMIILNFISPMMKNISENLGQKGRDEMYTKYNIVMAEESLKARFIDLEQSWY